VKVGGRRMFDIKDLEDIIARNKQEATAPIELRI
jgi:hypothetical protein